ncbi:glutamate--tRNA ligase [Candidatus Nomurabacteria bacterium RIFCSPHIGHO2_02_FULL_37_13]|uniref:Glutamate--tRNA ligase n=1 Tax=Candidatus Nomurabacteria bacterium RIFCSPHIGHO2_02_FULL_37_13 TaxID=1801750 RepID=A0A1F6W6V6_9BACT|nr:MAG: glutamate--tRNA ligase [Candidatus Nomurabacteria bacterium RIFCSPHIGHO2_01_FULL_36_23]OGI77658.1 MAG: glutamate--tRNA ligase [Candidatus Nomurabacteria bacterium RIFCSPHIGHO2_02_FULL_37_13]OGI88252.1 MAG: glutamate--tRNA ligase [Candidatus Nomurabacteria bacterium RIFCSPLOWO2_01_FULL_37_25]
MSQKVVTRMPPSPTGLFHIGSARTALFNYLYAKQNGGKFILRIEDTDKERSKKEFEDNIIESLKWLKMPYEEFYRQSERTEIYKKHLKKLINQKIAYVSQEEPKKEGDRGEVIRFKNPNKKIKFNDLVLGEIEFDTTDLQDFVIAKDLDTPLYHFAVVVDDIEMAVTHIIRGQDHISNTPRQILILEALGAARPQYAHIPLILSPDKSKLSKRHGALSVLEYKEMSYLPEAILNFLALIGWNPGNNQEIFTLEELLKEFSFKKIQKSGGIFNIKKLDWINKEHIKLLSPEEIEKNILKWLPENMRNPKLVFIILERISKWGDIKDMVARGELDFFFKQPKYAKEKLIYKNISPERIAKNLKLAIRNLENLPKEKFTKENINVILVKTADSVGSRGEVLHPIRYALSGMDTSPDPFVIAEILGKDETIYRLKKAI